MVRTAKKAFHPDEKDIRVFFAVDEAGSPARARELLRDNFNIVLTGERIGQIIQGFDETYGEVFARPRGRGARWTITEHGKKIRSELRGLLAGFDRLRGGTTSRRTVLPQIACLPHHILFIGELENLLMDVDPVGMPKIAVETLPQSHRATAEFEEWGLDPLVRGDYFMVIGPPPDQAKPIYADGLHTELIYSPRLEVMVHKSFPADFMSLEQLVERELFVPPTTMRSRQLLEIEIERAGLHGLDHYGKITNDSYETVADFFRILAEHRRPPEQRKVLVVPSDVALKFKNGIDVRAEEYQWVPLRRRDGAELTHPVHCTTQEGLSGPKFLAVKLLKEQVIPKLRNALTGKQVPSPLRPQPSAEPVPLSAAASLPPQRQPVEQGEATTLKPSDALRALADHLDGRHVLTPAQLTNVTTSLAGSWTAALSDS